MNYPVLQSKRCTITIATRTDAQWLHKLFNDEMVMRYNEGLLLFAESVEKTTDFIDCMLDAFNNGRGFLWKLSHQEVPIGFICTIDFDDAPSISYGVNKSYRHNGFMTEGLSKVLCYQNKIVEKSYIINIEKENIASQHLCNKLEIIYNIVLHKVL